MFRLRALFCVRGALIPRLPVLPPPLSAEEEAEILSRLDEGGEGRRILVERNLRLVVYIAKKFENTGVGSHTLKALGLSPDSICANCQHAVWHQTAPRNVRIFCLLMHVLVDEPLTLCDGKYITEK